MRCEQFEILSCKRTIKSYKLLCDAAFLYEEVQIQIQIQNTLFVPGVQLKEVIVSEHCDCCLQ